MHSRRWLLLSTVSVGLLLIALDNSILYTALPTLTHALDASATESLWIINAYPLVMAGLLLGAGTLGDRLGHRRMFLWGLALFGVASLVAAFSPNPEVLIAGRALLAVGAAAMMPATLSLIRIGFADSRERSLAIAMWGSVSVVGMALGPVISGLLLQHFWWGSVFLINIPIVLVALVAVPFVAPPNDADAAQPWDLMSSVQAMLALVGLDMVIKESVKPERTWWLIAASLVVGLLGAIFFVRRQARLDTPLLDFTVFRNRAFSAGVFAAALTTFAASGLQLITTQRVQLVAGYTPLQAGFLMSAVALGSLPTGLLAGATLHRAGLRAIITGGILVSAVGSLIATFTVASSLVGFVIGLVLIGAGMGAAMAVASTAIVGNAPRERAGMASSVENVSYEFGGLIAVAFLGSLLNALYAVRVDLPDGAPSVARDSLAEAVVSAAGNQTILQPAFAAFDSAYRIIALIISGLLVAAAVVTHRMLRAYGPGSESTLPDAEH